jgi:hypothetical protein
MNPHERKRQRVANLRQPNTAMASAFPRALMHWASRRANDETKIVVPTGVVTSEELRRVVCALIAITAKRRDLSQPQS